MPSLHELRELRPYRDEPRQLPSGAPGKVGFLKLRFTRDGARSILRELDRRTPLMAQKALYWDEALPGLPGVIMISTAGGVLQGDRNRVEIIVEDHAQAHVTTQSATKIQEMDANYATQEQLVRVGEDGYLEYLPDATMPYRHARYVSATRLEVAASATCLYAETLTSGRKHYGTGERFAYDLLVSTVEAVRPDGRPLFTERFVVEPQRQDPRHVGVMGPFDVFANVLLLTPPAQAARILAAVPAHAEAGGSLASGASLLPNEAGLVFKVLGHEVGPVQARVREFWALVRQTVLGAPIPEPLAEN
ncbi:MAG: urease accessory protein UreD [Geminicoccaceae bacterium]